MAIEVPKILKDRYEIREVLGKGGMGVVYKAFDTVVKREVALKTILDIADLKALELFHKEYEVLASISHPNIVEIFDLGEFGEANEPVPYFVMPLLSGMTLDRIIKTASHRLTVERTIEIISQTCRGLQAAHERGLVHRDMKPSNILVMDDDAVKIIDFGVVHKADAQSTKGLKGTLLYMPPELIEMKPPSALSDIFSLGVVAYEALTQRRPFDRANQYEIIQAVRSHIPPPASDFNSAVSQTVSRVIHKAMAKQPYHRFSTAREFAETLQKALRGETIEIFEPAKIQPRIQRATKAFEQGDYQFADEILTELGAEGHIDPQMSTLRRQLDQAVRQKRVIQLLESARTRFEEKEYPLALQKVEEVLQLEPDNASALSLKKNIEDARTEEKIEDWFRLVHQHIDNHAYTHARRALENVLQLRPAESRARQLLAEVGRLESEYLALRDEKEQLYKGAVDAWQKGEVSSALLKLERALELDRKAPDTAVPERGATYQNFYNQVRSEHDGINNSYAEARKCLADGNFARALEICNEYMTKYPSHALFQSLKFDVEEQQRQALSRYIAEIDRQIEAEPDLDKRVNILKEALNLHPGEPHFERSLRIMREKRDLVSSIVAKARLYEERGQFNEALGQWEILQTIYSQYPGLNFETERLIQRRVQQAREESKARVVTQVDRQLHQDNFAAALELLEKSKAEFPDDPELAELEKQARQGLERTAEALKLLEKGQDLVKKRRLEEATEIFRKARELDESHSAIRAALVDTLAERARVSLESDWKAAEDLLGQALELDPAHSQAKSLRTLAQDKKREEFVNQCVSQARQLQGAGDLEGAAKQVEQGLATYPYEPRFAQLRSTLDRELKEARRRELRRSDLDEMGRLDRAAEKAADEAGIKSLSDQAKSIVGRYPDDPEFRSVAESIESRLASAQSRLDREKTGPILSPPAVPAPPAEASEVNETLIFRGPMIPKAPKIEKPPGAPPPATPTEGGEVERTLIFRGQKLTTPPAAPAKPPEASPAVPPGAPAPPADEGGGTLIFRGPLISKTPAAESKPTGAVPEAPPTPAPAKEEVEETLVFRGPKISQPPAPPQKPSAPAKDEVERTLVFRGPKISKPPTAPEKPSAPPVSGKAQPPAPSESKSLLETAPGVGGSPARAAGPVKPPTPARPAAPAAPRPAKPAGPPSVEPPAEAAPSLLEKTVVREKVPKLRTPRPEPPTAPAKAETGPSSEETPGKPSRLPLIGGAVAAALVVIVAAVVLVPRLRKSGGPSGPTVALDVRTTPAGASIRVNDEVKGTANLRLDLSPGTYKVEALADGYENATTTVEVKLGTPASVDLTLKPLANVLRVLTDLDAGKVELDGNAAGDLQSGQFIFDKVAPGQHTVNVSARHGSVSFAFEAAQGAAPQISGAVTAKELKAVVITSVGNHARLYCSYGPVAALVDGKAVGDAGPGGLDLTDLSRGSHDLALGTGSDQRKIVLEVTGAPTLTAYLNSDRNVGTLVVVTGEDNARVLIDGREYRLKTKGGQVRIPNLDIKAYSVQVVKDGFQPVPPQRVEIRRGEETKLEFRLAPVPSVASLSIQGGAAGTQIVLDRTVLGTVSPDGTFSASNINPGEHTIELRRDQYRPKRIARRFGAGETVQLSSADLALEAAMGVLHLSLAPADSQVTITRAGETQARPVTGNTLNLPEGTYTLVAKATNYGSRTETVRLASGETKNVDLHLTRETRTGMSDWENPDAWTRDGNWYVRRGGNLALFKVTPTAGRIVFTAALRKGRRLQWVVGSTDERNYILFQMDKKFFYRSEVRNGAVNELLKSPLKIEHKGYVTVQVRITPTSVSHEVYDGKSWIPLDSWTEVNHNFASGKFGFLVPGGDEVAVSNFAFYP
ncbi:MAG: protein kinase [Terriglobia bacterium]